MKKMLQRQWMIIAILLLSVTISSNLYAQFSFSDNATNYGGSWANGNNFGTGYNAWTITTGGANSGTFIGNPSSNGMNTANIGTTAFGLFGHSGQYVNATRYFGAGGTNVPMQIGDVFSFYWAMNWDCGSSGSKGFDLRAGGTVIFNVNNSNSATITTTNGDANTAYGTDAMLVTLTRTSWTQYSFTMTSRSGGATFSTTINSSQNIDNINIYCGAQQDNNGNRNIYFNVFNFTKAEPYETNFSLTDTRVLSGSSNLTKTGTGNLTLNATNTFTGNTIVNQNFLVISADNNLGAAPGVATTDKIQIGNATLGINGTFTLNANRGITLTNPSSTIDVYGGQTATYNGIIAGSGSNGLTKAGPGTLVLGGANTYSGATTVSNGILRFGAAGVIPDASAVVLSGGTLSTGATTGFAETMGTLQLTASSTIALGTGSHNIVFANSSGVSWTANTILTITGWTGTNNGNSSGTGGRIFIGNSQTGVTATQLSRIRFNISSVLYGAMVLSTGEIVPTAGSVLYYGGTGASWTASVWSANESGPFTSAWVSGSHAVFNTANATITGATTNVSAVTASENVTVTATGTLGTGGTIAPYYIATGRTFNFQSQAISTAAGTGLIKNGLGNIISANGNATGFPAGVTLNTGLIAWAGINGFGSGTLTINGGALSADGSNRSPNISSIVVNADFQLGDVTNYASGTGNLTFAAPVALGSSVTRTITLGQPATYIFNGVVSGASSNLTLNATSAGVLALSAANTYGGNTTINGGTLRTDAANTLPSTTAVTLANAAGAILNLNGNNQSVVSLAGGGTTGGNVNLGAATLTLSGSTNTTYSGVISGTGGITRSGTGILTLAHTTNTFTGATTITSGELRFNPTANATYASQIVLNGGTLSTTGISTSTTVTSSSTLNLNAISVINLGSNVHTITFANSSGVTWNGSLLTINGWTGTGGSSGTAGKIFFGNTTGTLTPAQLAKITFTGYSGTTILLPTGELVPPVPPTTYTWNGSQTGGSWTDPANWTPGISIAGPTAADIVIIPDASSYTNELIITGSVDCLDFTVNANGKFTMAAASTLTVNGQYTYNSSTAPTLNCSSTLNLLGNTSITITAANYGNLNLSGGPRVLPNAGTVGICGTYTPGTSTTITGSTVNYIGTAAQTITATAYNNLTISNNRGGATITLAAGTITVNGVLNPTLSNYAASVTGNTIDFNNAGAQSIPAFIYGNITNTGNGNRTWANSGVIEVRGNFTPGTGTHTITGSTFRYAATSGTITLPTPASFTTNITNRQYNNLEFDGTGGTFVVNASLLHGVAGTLTINNGTVNMATTASATTWTVDGNFTINGGTLSLNNNTAATIFNLLSNFSQTGGTITRASTGGTTFNFETTGLGPIRTISQTGGTISGNFNIAITGTGIGPTLRLLTDFNKGSGTGNLTIASAQFLDCQTYVLSGGGSLIINNGGRIVTAHPDGISAAPSTSGCVLTTTRNFNTSALFYYNGTSAQVTGNGLPATLDRLYIQNSAGVTLTTASIGINTEIALNAGRLILGNNTITMSSTAFFSGTLNASNMIVTNGTGELRKSVTSSPTTFTWPVGDITGTPEYSPITLTVTFALNGYVGIRVVNTSVTPNGAAVNYINRHWVATTNLSSYSWSGSATYTAADIVGSEAALKLNIYDPNAPSIGWTQYANSAAGSNTLTITSGPGTGSLNNTSITAREDETLYYQSTGAGGQWNNAANWQVANNPSFIGAVAATTPPNNANSYGIWIRSGSPITIGSTVWADDLTIDAGAVLTVGAGGNFTLADGPAVLDFTNNGTFNINNTTTIQSGSTTTNNSLIVATSSPSSFGSITHTSTGIYNHAVDGGTIPTSTWNSGSLLRVTALDITSSVGGFNQTFHHVEFNSPSQNTASLQISGAFTAINGNLTMAASGSREVRIFAHASNTNTSITIGGNINVTGGRLSICNSTSNGTQAVTLNVSGNINISGGTLDLTGLSGNTSGTITLNLSGNVEITGTGTIAKTQTGNSAIFRFNKSSGTQTYSATAPSTAISSHPITWQVGDGTTQPELILSSDFVEHATATFAVLANATLNCGTNVLRGTTAGTTGSFTLNNNATLKMGSAGGISVAPNTTGNIQTGPAVGNRVFNTGSFYEYNGTVNQNSGDGLPATIGRLTINNTGTSGNNTVTLTISGATLSISNATNTLRLTSGLFAVTSAKSIAMPVNGTIVQTAGDFASGNLGGTVTCPGSSTVTVSGNVNFWNVSTTGGVDFGASPSNSSTINGSFTLNAGGFVANSNPPFYATNSNLVYATGYTRFDEWRSTSGRGYPFNVIVNSSQTFNLQNGGADNTPRQIAGSLTLNAASVFNMNATTGTLTILGNINLTGGGAPSTTLTLSTSIGGDLRIGGNWSNGASASTIFNHNSRSVTFMGTAPQIIGGTNSTTFAYLDIDNNANVTLNRNTIVANELRMVNGKLILDAFNLTLNPFASIQFATSLKYIVTDGNGLLIQSLGGVNTLYPVGPNTTQYAPATLAQSGTVDNIGVRVKTAPPFDDAVNDDLQMVNYQWYISEAVLGGNSLFTQFQWNGSDEATNFIRTNPVYHGDWTGSIYNIRSTGATGGSNPYTSSSSSNFVGNLNRVFVVGNLHGIKGCIATVQNGDWHTAATWEAGIIPPIDANVCVNHNVTVSTTDPDPVTSISFGGGAIFTVAPSRTITISGTGFLNNSKPGLNFGSGRVVFAGTGSVSGAEAITLNDVEINNGLTINTIPTINGTFRINTGGFISVNSLNYSSSSTLEYNTGGTYGRSLEWSATSGVGYPHHVLISGNTLLNLGNGGASTARQLGGNLTINSGSGLTMAGPPNMTATLTVKGNLFLNGSLALSNSAGGDLVLEGNWERNNTTGVFTANNRAIFFTGAADQFIKLVGGGTEFFPYVLINKPNAGTYVKMSNTGADLTDLRITGTSGGVLQLLNNGGLDLNGRTVGIDRNSNTGAPTVWIEVNGPREIINSGGLTNGEFKFYSTTNPNQPTWFTSAVKNVAGVGTLTFENNVLMTIADGACDFGVSSGNPITFIKGVLQVKLGGSVGQTMNPCFYSVGSTLRFANTVDYLVPANDKTWASGSITSGLPGIPYNVEILDAGTDLVLNDARSLKNNLTITNGTFTINPGAGSEFSLGGNWTRTGATSAFTNTAGARVVFRGSAPQTILCTTSGNTETFKELELDNNGGLGNNAITLSGSTRVLVTDSIVFTKGIITTGTNRVETNPATGYVASVGNTNYTNSWINGNLRRNINASNTVIEFPVGIATRGNLAVVYNNSLAGISYFDANFHPVAGGNNSEMDAWETSIPGTPYHTQYIAMNSGGFWTIEPDNQPTSGTYDLRLYFNGMLSGMADNQFGILKRANGSSTYADFKPFPGTSINTSGGLGRLLSDGFALRMGYTSFSEFGIGLSGVPLPVQLTSFIGYKDGAINQLVWKTASELNTLEFVVERSTNGINFTEIGAVDAAGFSTMPLTYNFTDANPANGINYYRLKMIDIDYTYEYSNIIALNNTTTTIGNDITIYPNPSEGDVFASINGIHNQNIICNILDVSGRVISSTRIALGEGNNLVPLNTASLAAGVYMIEFRDEYRGRLNAIKFVKKN